MAEVLNIRFACGKDFVYIGRDPRRPMHYGNPFSHQAVSIASVKVASREEAIARFETWLDGTSDQTVEPARRLWIVQHLVDLAGHNLGCHCRPKACHGDVLLRRASAARCV